MSPTPVRVRFPGFIAAFAVAVGAALTATLFAPPATAAAVTPPPPRAKFDYQIGGAYPPPSGVTVVSRDREAAPAPGLYNICYVNAFQVQPGEQGDWDGDLLLRDSAGRLVIDEDWGEPLLDLRTAAKRQRIAAKVNGWISRCADDGFQAVEPDNYDSYTRSKNLVTASHAQAYIRLLSAHAHSEGLAIAQKNTVELAENRVQNGLDFAIAEECGYYRECGDYTAEFGDKVIVIEYTSQGLSRACSSHRNQLSIVRRDVDVSPAGSRGYVYQTC